MPIILTCVRWPDAEQLRWDCMLITALRRRQVNFVQDVAQSACLCTAWCCMPVASHYVTSLHFRSPCTPVPCISPALHTLTDVHAEQLLSPTRALCICRHRSNARFVASAACHTLRLLPAAETEQLDKRLADVFMWASQAPAVYLSHGYCADVAMLPTLLLSLLEQQLLASVAYSTMRQVVHAGDRAAAEASWAPLQQVRVEADSCCMTCCCTEKSDEQLCSFLQ